MMEEEFQQQIHPCSLLFPLPSPGAVLAPGCAGKITKLTSLKWYAYCFDLFFLKIYFLFISEHVPGLQVPPTESRRRCQRPWSWSYMSSLATLWCFWEPFESQGLNLLPGWAADPCTCWSYFFHCNYVNVHKNSFGRHFNFLWSIQNTSMCSLGV